MSRRTPGLPRRAREFWPTPAAAVAPLVPYLPARPTAYIEPCAGAGDLVRGLAQHWPWGTCALACDVVPEALWIEERDLYTLDATPDLYIVNPPWPTAGSRGEPVLSMVRHLSSLAPTWMLLDHGFTAARYFAEVAASCVLVVPAGRPSWMGNGQGGKSDAAWLLFDARHEEGPRLRARAA